MAGFSKEAVIEALAARLKEQAERSRQRHESSLAEWEKDRARIGRAKKNLRQAVRDLTDDKIEIEAFAKRINDSGTNYRHPVWTVEAAKTVPKPPVQQESENEVAIKRLIRLAESSTSDAFTITELKSLGILEWIKTR
ncbi:MULTISPECIES: hypothetical protein [unclassified Leucobacter]|uniref:hypothetical protein n=1 Tax=unclassified Leucobacter TaxID=2621730 RepID=UPI003016FE8E